MDILEFIYRLGVAILAGFIIGFERQWHNKPTGLRTNMLVATGSAIFVLLSVLIKNQDPNTDVTRIISQVVTGIGFLGAGVIFREGTSVHGLTSAATVWCSAAIGCIAATGYFIEAFICTALVVIVNSLIQPIDKWLSNRK